MGDFREHMLSLVVSKILAKNEAKSCLSACLVIVKENSLLQQKESVLHDLISHTNSCLNSSTNRQEGLLLLNELIDQCEDEVFQGQVLTWCKLISAALQSYDPNSTLELCCVVMMKLLQRVTGFPEANHEVANSVIPQLLQNLIQAKPEWRNWAIKCLTVCLKYFHGPCGPVQKKMETFILGEIHAESTENMEIIGECYSLLAQAGGGGNMGTKHTEMWVNHMSKVMTSLKALLIDLYSVDPAVELPVMSDSDRINLGYIPEEEPHRTIAFQTYFKKLAVVANCMLRTEFRASVRIPVEEILDTLCAALSVSPKQLMLNSNYEKTILSCVLPFVHTSAFSILSSLIDVCGSNLMLYTNIVNKLFVQVLNYSSPDGNTHRQAYRELRCQVYTTLITWLERMGALSNVNKISSQLLPHLTQDIKPHQHVVKMASSSVKNVDAVGGKFNKKKRRAMNNDFGKLNVQEGAEQQREYGVTRKALKVLKLILMKSGSLVSQEFHMANQDLIVGALLNVQSSSHCPAPYTDVTCRKSLYNALLWLVLHPHPNWVPPTHCALRIFRKGHLDSANEVKRICSKALASCEVVIHPRAPSLLSPISMDIMASGATNNVVSSVLQTANFSYQDMYRRIEIKDRTDGENPVNDVNDEATSTGSGEEKIDLTQNKADEKEGNSDQEEILSGGPKCESRSDSVEEEVIELSDQEQDQSLIIVGQDTNSMVVIDSASASDEEPKLNEKGQEDRTEDTKKQGSSGVIPNGRSPNTRSKGEKRRLSEAAKDEPATKMKLKDDSMTEQVQTEEVTEMLSTFVDAGPDSD